MPPSTRQRARCGRRGQGGPEGREGAQKGEKSYGMGLEGHNQRAVALAKRASVQRRGLAAVLRGVGESGQQHRRAAPGRRPTRGALRCRRSDRRAAAREAAAARQPREPRRA